MPVAFFFLRRTTLQKITKYIRALIFKKITKYIRALIFKKITKYVRAHNLSFLNHIGKQISSHTSTQVEKAEHLRGRWPPPYGQWCCQSHLRATCRWRCRGALSEAPRAGSKARSHKRRRGPPGSATRRKQGQKPRKQGQKPRAGSKARSHKRRRGPPGSVGSSWALAVAQLGHWPRPAFSGKQRRRSVQC